MKKLSDKKLKALKDKGLIVKTVLGKKQTKEIVPAGKSVESSLQEMTGYIKTIVTKDKTVDIAMNSAFKLSRALDLTVDKLEALTKKEQVLAWDIEVVDRDRNDFIKSLSLKAVG